MQDESVATPVELDASAPMISSAVPVKGEAVEPVASVKSPRSAKKSEKEVASPVKSTSPRKSPLKSTSPRRSPGKSSPRKSPVKADDADEIPEIVLKSEEVEAERSGSPVLMKGVVSGAVVEEMDTAPDGL